MKIYKKDKEWICEEDGYLYKSNTLRNLLNILNTEWEDEKYCKDPKYIVLKMIDSEGRECPVIAWK